MQLKAFLVNPQSQLRLLRTLDESTAAPQRAPPPPYVTGQPHRQRHNDSQLLPRAPLFDEPA